MSEPGNKSTQSPQQSDALLWLGGTIIVGLGVTWLLLSKPWAGGADFDPAVPPQTPAARALEVAAAPAAAGSAAGAPSVRADLETSLEDNPLRMAELAYEAGMLVEPEDYSAWALYKRAAEQDPGNDAARAGLEKIANEILKRANVAVEQGRIDDALATVARVRSAIPAHPGANDLAFKIESLRPARVLPADESQARTAELDDERPARAEPADRDGGRTAAEPSPAAPPPAPEPAAPQVDPVLAPYSGFGEALARNRLLTPTGSSAKHFLDAMIAIDPNHEMTRDAISRFSEELLARANAAIIELDAAAAETWLEEAGRLGVNAVPVADARERLRRRLIEAETARRVPVSALELTHYVPPSFPPRALERSFEGWVDLEFTVGRDGRPRDIVVTDASNNTFFRREAVEAVEQWRFVPRVFMDEIIEQRAYTRIRFTFD